MSNLLFNKSAYSSRIILADKHLFKDNGPLIDASITILSSYVYTSEDRAAKKLQVRFEMSEDLLYVGDENFTETVSSGVTLVDFYADWCGPCRMIAPIVETLATEYKGKAKIAKLDIEAAQNTTSQFGVTSIPTIIFFKDGKEVDRVVGVKDEEALKKLLDQQIS